MANGAGALAGAEAAQGFASWPRVSVCLPKKRGGGGGGETGGFGYKNDNQRKKGGFKGLIPCPFFSTMVLVKKPIAVSPMVFWKKGSLESGEVSPRGVGVATKRKTKIKTPP